MFSKSFNAFAFLLFFTATLATREADDTARVKRSDDVTTASLQAVVERQVALTQTLQAEISALKTKMTTLSKTVAFTVRFKADDSAHGLGIPKQATLNFDDIVFNLGDGYDPHKGKFTAPLAGTYSFFLNVMGVGGGHVAVLKNGAVLELVWSNTGDDQGASMLISRLEKGDAVWVANQDGKSIRGSWYTVFTGFLLQAD